jgi:capsular exopolysaccharide synthesis family protein
MTTLPTSVAQDVVASSGGGSGPTSRSLTPSDVLTMLRRRTVLIVILFILFLLASIGGFAVWWKFFPGYQAECLIECVSNIPEGSLSIEVQRLRQEEHERFVATQALLIKSPAILGDALQLNAVRETEWYKSVDRRNKDHLLELTADLSAAPVRRTNFLRVSLESRRVEDPAVIVSNVVRIWLDAVKKRSSDAFATDLDTAQTERDNLDGQITDLRRRLQGIASRLPPGARQDPVNNSTAQTVRQTTEQITILRLELSQLEQLRTIYNNPQGLAATAEERALVDQDPEVAELRRAYFLLQQQRAADASRFGENHAVLVQLDSQLQATTDKLAQLEAQKLFEIQAANLEAAETAYSNTQHALLLAQERLARAEAALQDQDRLLFEYSNLEADIEQQTLYRTQLSEYIQSLERVVRQRSGVDIRIAQPATDPRERSSPSILMVPAGVFMSLVLALGIGLGLELLNTSIRTPQDISAHLNVPLLGIVPDTDDEEVDIAAVETAARDAPRSMVAEAFRRIRTSLQFSAPAAKQRSLLVTSLQPEDGTTSAATNLAIAVAQSGKRVLLIDANFRRPALHRVFGGEASPGLSNILIGDASLATCVRPTGTSGLDLLAGGPTPPNPAELLGGESCRSLLKEATTTYDQVIIDSAPLLVAADPLVLATETDGVMLIIRANSSSRGMARRAASLLGDVGAHLFGTVLNAVRVTRGGYFREQLRTYYDYQAEVSKGKRSRK